MTQQDRDRLVVLRKVQKQLINASAGGRGVVDQRAAGAAATEGAEGAGRQGCDSRLARTAVETEDQQREAATDCGDPFAGGLLRLRSDAGERVPARQAPG